MQMQLAAEEIESRDPTASRTRRKTKPPTTTAASSVNQASQPERLS